MIKCIIHFYFKNNMEEIVDFYNKFYDSRVKTIKTTDNLFNYIRNVFLPFDSIEKKIKHKRCSLTFCSMTLLFKSIENNEIYDISTEIKCKEIDTQMTSCEFFVINFVAKILNNFSVKIDKFNDSKNTMKMYQKVAIDLLYYYLFGSGIINNINTRQLKLTEPIESNVFLELNEKTSCNYCINSGNCENSTCLIDCDSCTNDCNYLIKCKQCEQSSYCINCTKIIQCKNLEKTVCRKNAVSNEYGVLINDFIENKYKCYKSNNNDYKIICVHRYCPLIIGTATKVNNKWKLEIICEDITYNSITVDEFTGAFDEFIEYFIVN